jgi:adenosylcobyric acid synthase
MSFENMKSNYDTILIEGAGSAFELNLKERDLANQYIMNKNNVYNVLIANIENGGVFPSIIGSKLLMSEEQKHRFRGVIINNFRGDITLFDEGVKILEDEYNIPVIGVIPNIPYGLDVEDSLSLMYSSDKKRVNLCNIGIIKYPHASNMNDIEPLVHDPNVSVSYINQKINLEIFDCVILPGSRSVIDDLRWLKSTGLFDDLQTTKTNIYGICGGYQMMHQKINDPLGSESSQKISQSEDGLGFIPGQIEFKKNKILLRKDFELFDGIMVHGFEMHTGISDSNPMFYQSDNISGSIVHEIFHCDNFRSWWIQKISKIKPKLWDYRSWKKQIQNNVAEIIMDKLDFEKLLGKNF